MKLNNIDVDILASIELIDAYNKNYPEKFIYENVIYCIHNKVNNKNYIGQTVNFMNRFSETYVGHFRDYNRSLNGELSERRIIYKAWNKYGFESFIVYIIDTGIDREDLNKKEEYWIKTLHTCTKDPECLGYNLSWGAEDLSGFMSPEAIKKSIETRIKKYGNAWANCNTPEAFEKGARTKVERYGQSGWVNAHTPEAIEKRKQTLIEKYGHPHSPKPSKEAIDRMVAEKVEKYGDPMGICNTPENREKATKNMRITVAFNIINENLFKSPNAICNFDQYYNFILTIYSTISSAHRHLKRLKSLLSDLIVDKRWTVKLTAIFQDLIDMSEESLNNMIKSTIKKRRKDAGDKMKGISRGLGTSLITRMLKSINLNISKTNSSIINWKDYCNLVLANYVDPHHAYKHLDKLIDLLPQMKQDSRWTEEYELIFGSLTEKDKVKHKRKEE